VVKIHALRVFVLFAIGGGFFYFGGNDEDEQVLCSDRSRNSLAQVAGIWEAVYVWDILSDD